MYEQHSWWYNYTGRDVVKLRCSDIRIHSLLELRGTS